MHHSRRADRSARGIRGLGMVYYFVAIYCFGLSYFAFSQHVVAGIAAVLLGILQFVVGYGLRDLKKWAWEIGVANAILGLLNCPIGTIVSGFAFHYLIKGKHLFK